MGKKHKLAERIIAWVRENPGHTAREVGQACGFDHLNGMVSYMKRQGMLYVAGGRYWQRYYVTAEEALANHDRVCAEAIATRAAKQAICARKGQIKRTAVRRAKKRVACEWAPDAKFTPAEPMRDRFAVAVAPGYFASLRIGEYAPGKTHLARVYGGQV